MGPQFSLPGLICNSIVVSSFIIVVRCFVCGCINWKLILCVLVVLVEHRDVTSSVAGSG